MSSELDHLNCKLFAENLHSKFKAALDQENTLVLELTEVDEKSVNPRVECFSVLFQGPPAPMLSQGMRRLEHEKLGTFDLFLTPIGIGNDGSLLYEAVFNRMRKENS